MAKNQDANRRKLLKLLSREQLERLSHRDRPWLMSRPDLETEVLATWSANADEIKEAVDLWVNRAFE